MGDNIVIEEPHNCSYITSLLTALFYYPSKFDMIVTVVPSDLRYVYLQEIIKFNFIEKLRKKFSISKDNISKIRNICIMLGWQYDNTITKLFDVTDFYKFLVFNINCKIKYRINEVNYNDPIITINLDDYNAYIKMIDSDDDVKAMEKFNVNELYENVIINVNKIDKNIGVTDIKKAIKLRDARLNVHSLICFFDDHYYTIIRKGALNEFTWYMIDTRMTPSVIEIDMKRDEIKNKIKKDVCLILYQH